MTLEKKAFEDIVGNGENAGNQPFWTIKNFLPMGCKDTGLFSLE